MIAHLLCGYFRIFDLFHLFRAIAAGTSALILPMANSHAFKCPAKIE
jgi:hypothetical protein